MSLIVTLAILAVLVGVFAFGSWRSAQPADPLNPRLVPWRPVIIAAGVAAIIMVGRLISLMGFDIGTR